VPATRKLAWPVVSIGSLSAGGAGKTPVVIALAELLKRRGWTVDVLSRGYGRSECGIERVIPDMAGAAQRFGDEPVLIASRSQIPVWVGGDRYTAGLAAESSIDAARGLHLLDDGFQHRRLARTLDVVLVTKADLEDTLLPAGNLREPLRALRRADIIVVREEELEAIEPRLKQLVLPAIPGWTIRRDLYLPGPIGSQEKALAFCAIARPENFLSMLQAAGYTLANSVLFDDHHPYSMADIDRLLLLANQSGATRFLITEKDQVKLTDAMYQRLASVGSVDAVGLRVTFQEEDAVLRELEDRIR
jgi:tetraacyldisaccharide 4'-kinase